MTTFSEETAARMMVSSTCLCRRVVKTLVLVASVPGDVMPTPPKLKGAVVPLLPPPLTFQVRVATPAVLLKRDRTMIT